MRRCSLCGKEKPNTAFDDRRNQCKQCRYDIKKAKYDPEKQRVINNRASWRVRASRYGVTEAELLALWDAQNYCCAICERHIEVPHVDHDHKTGVVRGLLCASCNRAIGIMQDDPVLLQRAINYLVLSSSEEVEQRSQNVKTE